MKSFKGDSGVPNWTLGYVLNKDLYLYNMVRRDKITTIFPKHLFWDMDYSKLSLRKDKDIIIPRALFASTRGTFVTDIERLENLYSTNEILDTLKSTRERLSNNVCELVAKRYSTQKFSRFSK